MRAIEVEISIQQKFGLLITSKDDEVEESVEAVPRVRGNDVVSIPQQFHVLATARNHTQFTITFDLYLEEPLQDLAILEPGMVMIERHTVCMQVSNMYTYQPNAQFLLITNPKTTARQSQAIQNFIKTDLKMEVDLCNIHQNGGLLWQREIDGEEPRPITENYHGKTVIVHDNSFDFFSAGQRTASQLFDPEWLFNISESRGSCLFIGSGDPGAFEDVTQSATFPLSTDLNDAFKDIQRSHCFPSAEELVKSFVQDKQLGNTRVGLSVIPLSAKWYRFGRSRAEINARDLARHIHTRLLNERLLVSHATPNQVNSNDYHRFSSTLDLPSKQSQSIKGYLVVLAGIDQHHFLTSTESDIKLIPAGGTDPTPTRLDHYTRYMIIAAIPFAKRVDLLWRNVYSNPIVAEAIKLSVLMSLVQQIAGFLQSPYKALSRIDENDPDAVEKFFKTHLPYLSDLFKHRLAKRQAPPPDEMLEVLQSTLSFASSIRHHKRLYYFIRSAIENSPSTKSLASSQVKNLYSTNPPCSHDILLQRISQCSKTPEYFLTKGQRTSSDIVPRTRHCRPTEWDAIVRQAGEWKKRLAGDMGIAEKVLGQMVLDSDEMEPEQVSELG